MSCTQSSDAQFWRSKKICCYLDSREKQPVKTGVRHDWVEKVIHSELCKKFKFDHTKKWYVHNPESVLENETQKIL